MSILIHSAMVEVSVTDASEKCTLLRRDICRVHSVI